MVFRRLTGRLLGRPLRRGHIPPLGIHGRTSFHFSQGIGSRWDFDGRRKCSYPRGSRGKGLVAGDEGQATRELSSNVVFVRRESGGVLQDSGGEDSALDDERELLACVEATPATCRFLGELDHHREAGFPRAASLRAAMPQSDRREGALNCIGGAQVAPVLR